MDVEIRHLRALVALADCGGHSAAARHLGVSQPTVTRAVHQIEHVLGVTLVHRGSAELTIDGTEVVLRARHVLAEVDALRRDLQGQGVIRIAFAWLLPEDWYREMRGATARAGNTTTITRVDDPLAALASGTADVSIHREPLTRLPAGINCALIGTEQRVLAVSEYDPAFPNDDPVPWDMVARRPVVVNTVSGSTTAESIHSSGGGARVVECRNFDEWLELVAAGEGVGPVPEICARRVHHPHVRYLPLVDAPPTSVHLAWRADPPPPRAVRTFVESAITSLRK